MPRRKRPPAVMFARPKGIVVVLNSLVCALGGRENLMRRKHLSLMVALLIAGTSAAVSGCFGWIELPAQKVSYTVAQGMVYDPSQGQVTVGETVGKIMIEGLTCNLPSRNELEDLLRDAAGTAAAGLVQLEDADMDKITLTATQGDFAGLTGLALFYVTVGGEGVEPAYLGSAFSASGFGAAVEITPEGRVDLLDMMDGQLCGAVLVIATGTAGGDPVVFDAQADISIRASVGF